MDNIKIVKVTPAKSIAHKCTSKLLEVVLNIDHASISKFRGSFGTVIQGHVNLPLSNSKDKTLVIVKLCTSSTFWKNESSVHNCTKNSIAPSDPDSDVAYAVDQQADTAEKQFTDEFHAGMLNKIFLRYYSS